MSRGLGDVYKRQECKIAACLYQLEGQDEKARDAEKYGEGLVCQTTEPEI